MVTVKAPALPQRVLIAEDEHLIALSLVTGLKQLGCTVLGPFADGKAAIDSLASDTPDLAVLDIRMPNVDGLTVAKTLWDDHAVPSIIVTAFSDESYIERARDTGVFGYLLKPVSPDSLKAALNVAWSQASNVDARNARIKQLEDTLTHRRVVEQAKWELVKRHRLSEAEAHAKLQQTARDHRRKLIDVANDVLSGKLLP